MKAKKMFGGGCSLLVFSEAEKLGSVVITCYLHFSSG